MKRFLPEQQLVALMFILVIIVFSFAQRDSKKLDQLYSTPAAALHPLMKERQLAGAEPAALPLRQLTRH
jgi:hypothetical protein